SDDGKHALVLIAFIGSVFSPYYFKSRERESTTPYDHCAVNVALYGPSRRLWAFTEYRATAAQFTTEALQIGGNRLPWDHPSLHCRIDEIAAPLPWPVRGNIRLHPQARSDFALALDRNQMHWWQPLAPRATVEVEFERPAIRWRGSGYLDTNRGAAPLDE